MAATAGVMWLCACVRYWPDRGLVVECVICFDLFINLFILFLFFLIFISCIARCKNVRGPGKSIVVFHLFEELRYSNESSQLNLRVFIKNKSI